jgi:hypothetical protein
MKYMLAVSLLLVSGISSIAQKPHTGSFIARMGTDTVLVETYSMVNNHLFGKSFIRIPEDYIGEFSIHFNPNGSIREFNMHAMDPLNSSVPFKSTSGAFWYTLNMICKNDTCVFYVDDPNEKGEGIFRHAATSMDFVGGWVPLISLMEWNCMRLKNSGKDFLPLRMINHIIGVYPIGVKAVAPDTVLFGGPFIEYTRIAIDNEGRIKSTTGLNTPWSYMVSSHAPLNVDEMAKRMALTKGIGLPSGWDELERSIQGTKVKIEYGRPYKRGRKIFGGVVPYDSVWRTGAGSPTLLSLEKDIRVGNKLIPKGKYSIYTIPGPGDWKLIFNTDTERWPTDPTRSKDYAIVIIPSKRNQPIVDNFTIDIVETPKGGVIYFKWDDTVAMAEFELPGK